MSVARKSLLVLAAALLPVAALVAADRTTPTQQTSKPATLKDPAATAGQPTAKPLPAGYEPGERWRTTMSMAAMGMTMPGMSNEVCVPKGGDASQAGLDKNCQTSNFRRSGNKISYHVVCTGKDPMEGDMEIENLGPDHYRGRMTAVADGEQMTMTYEGQKLPGECDAGEMKRKMNAIVAQHDAQMVKVCREGAKSLQYALFAGADAQCKDPKDKATFCSAVGTHKGFGTLSQQERWTRKSGMKGQVMALSESAKVCGFAAEAKRKELCASAEGKGAWVFLANECPAIADPLAQRECAGRDFTTPVAPKYVAFCDAYGKDRSLGDAAGEGDGAGDGAAAGDNASQGQSGAADGASAEPQKESVGDKAKKGLKKLKGLFGN